MNTDILPPDFKYGSASMVKFFKTANVDDICATHDKYLPMKDIPKWKNIYLALKNALDIMEEHGLVYSYIDPSTSHLRFKVASVDTVPDKDVLSDDVTDDDLITSDDTNCELLFRSRVAMRYARTVDSARRRGIHFSMSFDVFYKLMSEKRCFYTGIEFDQNHVLSIDRIDSNLGYTDDNTVACSVKINSLKNVLLECKDAVFKDDIVSLKRFVDIMYVCLSKGEDPLMDLLKFK